MQECREDQARALSSLRPELTPDISRNAATRFCECLLTNIAGHPDYPVMMKRVEKGEGLKVLQDFPAFSDVILQKCTQ